MRKQSLFERLQVALASREPKAGPAHWGWQLARYALALTGDVVEGELDLRAMSLVYTTLLSLVPLLALAFSLLKAFGVHHGLEAMLQNMLQPLGPDAATIANQMVGFVDNVKVGVLGAVGIAFLLYAAVSMISKVESSFNYLWEVQSRGRRIQRFGEYFSVLVIGPFVLFSVLGMTASLRNQHVVSQILASGPFGDLLVWMSKLASYLVMVIAFVFIYSFMPNIRVRLKSAVIGGLFTGIAWQTASVVFATFVARASNYNAIYSGFAILIFLLLWIYVGWLIVLLGCRLSFYVQFPRRLIRRHQEQMDSNREREIRALCVYAHIARRYLHNQAPCDATVLCAELHIENNELQQLLAPLLQSDMVVESAADGAFFPGRDILALPVAEVWQCIRQSTLDGTLGQASTTPSPARNYVTEAEARADTGLTVRKWLEEHEDQTVARFAKGRTK